MKFFVVIIHYKIPVSLIEQIRPAHREFLQGGYRAGKFLISGPRSSGMGGVVLSKSNTLEELIEYFNNDPYKLKDATGYEFIEFIPGSWHPYIDRWIKPEK